MAEYLEKRDQLLEQWHALSGPVRLGKDTSNLFRTREKARDTLNVRDFNRVLGVDDRAGTVEVEGMTPYMDLVDATLSHRVMPCVVPQLKSITIGGAISGVGIESTSFRYGLVHETVHEMDVLTGNGDVITCTPENEHSDLFFGLPNSYGTLGYVLRLRAKTLPVKPYVKLEHRRHSDVRAYFQHLHHASHEDIDFLDGVIFGPDQYYVTKGRLVDEAPYTSDYTYKPPYFRSIQTRESDYLTIYDYLWRWDTDWFWCSKNVGAQHPLLRPLFGRKRLNSIFYTKIMRWNSRWGLTNGLNAIRGVRAESVIQDVDIPINRAHEFYDFFQREIGISPVWICPIGVHDPAREFPLYPMQTDQTYVNFGFWDVVRTREKLPAGHYNRKIEDKVEDLGGIKSLYSDSYYSRETFWRIYNQTVYESLKHRYDGNNRLPNLYDKCVLRI